MKIKEWSVKIVEKEAVTVVMSATDVEFTLGEAVEVIDKILPIVKQIRDLFSGLSLEPRVEELETKIIHLMTK